MKVYCVFYNDSDGYSYSFDVLESVHSTELLANEALERYKREAFSNEAERYFIEEVVVDTERKIET